MLITFTSVTFFSVPAIFLVNEREWTGVNYALLVISIVLLVGGPGWLAGLYIKREVLPKLKNRRKTE